MFYIFVYIYTHTQGAPLIAQSVKNSPCNATDVDSVSRLGRHDKESDMTEQLTLSLFIYICVYVCVCIHTWWCATLCNSMDWSPPGFSVHRILQATILEWLPFPPPGDLPDPRNWTQVSCIAVWATWEVTYIYTHTQFYTHTDTVIYVTHYSVCVYTYAHTHTWYRNRKGKRQDRGQGKGDRWCMEVRPLVNEPVAIMLHTE